MKRGKKMFFVVASLINLFMAVYIVISLLGPLHVNNFVKLLMAIVVLLLSQKIWLTAAVSYFNHSFNPSDYWFTTATGFIQILLFCFFIVALTADIISVPLAFLHVSLAWKVPIVTVIATVIAAYGFYEAVKVPAVKAVTVESELLPENFQPATIAVLSDLHIVTNSVHEKKWLEKTVEKTNALNADMIFVTGDIIDASVGYLKDQVKPLFDLKAKGGVYYVFGNHETYRGAKAWQKYFDANGAQVINDKWVGADLGDNPVLVAGIYENPNLLDNMKSGRPVILLAHYPDTARKIPEDLVVLQVSGHTHGGQIKPLAPLVARMNGGFVNGLYNIGKTKLYVHPGTGLWRGFPFRFLTPSEITLITLKRKE